MAHDVSVRFHVVCTFSLSLILMSDELLVQDDKEHSPGCCQECSSTSIVPSLPGTPQSAAKKSFCFQRQQAKPRGEHDIHLSESSPGSSITVE